MTGRTTVGRNASRRRLARAGLAAVFGALAAPIPAIEGGAFAAEELSGSAQVVDAVSLQVGGRQVRLYGIAAPELGVRCAVRKATVDCGHVAATALMDLTAATDARCTIVDGDAVPPVARCTAGGYDLSEGMVYTGWARPMPDAPARLHRAEQTARERKHGLWRNGFPPSVSAAVERPSDQR